MDKNIKIFAIGGLGILAYLFYSGKLGGGVGDNNQLPSDPSQSGGVFTIGDAPNTTSGSTPSNVYNINVGSPDFSGFTSTPSVLDSGTSTKKESNILSSVSSSSSASSFSSNATLTQPYGSKDPRFNYLGDTPLPLGYTNTPYTKTNSVNFNTPYAVKKQVVTSSPLINALLGVRFF